MTLHHEQVLDVTSAACVCNTSWTAFWLRYRPPHYDGAFTFCYSSPSVKSPSLEDLEEATVHWSNTFHGHFTGSAFAFLLGPGIEWI